MITMISEIPSPPEPLIGPPTVKAFIADQRVGHCYIICPHCHYVHLHGAMSGHRAAHCCMAYERQTRKNPYPVKHHWPGSEKGYFLDLVVNPQVAAVLKKANNRQDYHRYWSKRTIRLQNETQATVEALLKNGE